MEYIKYNDIGMRVALLAHITDTKTDQEVQHLILFSFNLSVSFFHAFDLFIS